MLICYHNPAELAEILRRAETAHKATNSARPDDWPRWYAEWMFQEQADYLAGKTPEADPPKKLIGRDDWGI